MTHIKQHRVFISPGTNLGDKEMNLDTATQWIAARVGKIKASSSRNETAPWGYADQPEFLNQVLEIETMLPPGKLMEVLLQIEAQMGRKRTFKNASRVIDIDILFYDCRIIQISKVTIPHPFISKRRFILVPLCELAPEFIHPVLKKNIQTLLAECTDPLDVKKLGDKIAG